LDCYWPVKERDFEPIFWPWQPLNECYIMTMLMQARASTKAVAKTKITLLPIRNKIVNICCLC